jgi:hypothetical protein
MVGSGSGDLPDRLDTWFDQQLPERVFANKTHARKI